MADEDVERAAVEEILKSAVSPDDSFSEPAQNDSSSMSSSFTPAATAETAGAAVAAVDFSVPPPTIPPPGIITPGSLGNHSATGAAEGAPAINQGAAGFNSNVPGGINNPTAAHLAAGAVHWSVRGRGDLVSTLRNPIRPARGGGDFGPGGYLPRGGFRGRGGPDVVTTLRNPPGPYMRRRKFIGLEDEEQFSDEERRDRWNRTRDGSRKEYDPNGDYIYDARKFFDADKYRQICANRRKKFDKQREVEEAAEAQHRSYLAYMSGHYPYIKPVITRPLPPVRADSDSDEFDYDYYDELTRAETIAAEMSDPMYPEDQFQYDEGFFAPYPEPPGPFEGPPRRFDEPMMFYNDYGPPPGFGDEFYPPRGPPGGPYMMDRPPGGGEFGPRGPPPHFEDERRMRRSRSRGGENERQRSYSRSPLKRSDSFEEKRDRAEGSPSGEEGKRFRGEFGDRNSAERSPARRFPDGRR